ncbi:hypothetical protein [Pseudoalteromonas aurantia]|uniref:Glutaredoxin domain-containing protein n=1 Tax=Pseudoalteromonas aurantia TaxID=43654 RepID=A0A5S3V7Q0_9GAMM|nr:hypothetical protein [Pseudoalteromonas aurantia]TMO67027.1 hypothetical protein CWC19_14950 [Pseudoalteromonas aurantia]
MIDEGNYASILSQHANDSEILVLSLNYCDACQKLFEFLDLNNVDYNYNYNYHYLDIAKSDLGLKLYKEFNVSSVPIIYLKNIRMIGFDTDLLNEELKRRNLL